VACDAEGAAIAQACPAVNKVRVMTRGWIGVAMGAMQLRGYDVVISAKGGFDRRLAMLARLTDAPVRIGYTKKKKSRYYTHSVPVTHALEHQIQTCMRLLDPLDVQDKSVDLSLRLPESAITFARDLLSQRVTDEHRFVAVLCLSSNRSMPWSETRLITLTRRLITDANALVAISCLPTKSELARAEKFAAKVNLPSIFVLQTPEILQLGAVMRESGIVITPEGGMGHLAAALHTPALVLWGEGPFEKWRTWSDNHRTLRIDRAPKRPVTLEDAWQAIGEVVRVRK
jgi:ADP-heptose:LPS heptosyltransferase